MGAYGVDSRIEGGARTAQCLEAQRRHDVGGQQEPPGVVQQQAGRAGHEVGAVEDAEGILGLQLQGLDAQSAQRVSATLSLTFDEHVSLTDQQQAEVRRGRQVAAGAERSFLGHPGPNIAIQQLQQPFGDLRTHARCALAELVDADQHPGPYQLLGQRRTDADCVAHEQVALQLPAVGRRDPDVLQRPDTGRQAVDDPILAHQPVHEVAGGLQPARRFRTKADPLAMARHRHDIGRAQRLAVEREGQALAHVTDGPRAARRED